METTETAYYKNQPFNLKVNGRAEVSQTCPLCSEGRKKKSDPCLSYNSNLGLGKCHHCGATFHRKEQAQPFDLVNFFAHRKISKATLDHFNISFDGKAILFPFIRNGQTLFNKYRTPDKKFRLSKGAELFAFNIDALKGFDTAVIVEGEIDVLSLHEAETTNVISVPNGAVKDGRNTFKWLDRSWPDLQHIENFIIAVDDDLAGNNLAWQLIKELRTRGKVAGRAIPTGYKDVNDQLCAIGEIILDGVEEVEPQELSVSPEILKTKDAIFYNSRGESFMVVDGKNAKEISNKQLHEIWYQLHPVEKLRPQFNTFYHRLLAETPSVDPWNNIFETAWSGEDQFANLSKYVNAERDTFIKDLSKHMIRGINQVYNEPTHRLVNRYVFCLQSEQKHIGKSTLVGKLTLSNVSGFGGEKDLSETSKEIKRSMCQLFNMIWEEVDSLTRKEVNGLKTLISLSSYSGRVLYSEQQSTKPRTATLWATVNPRDFLGSTDKRWIVHPITNIDFAYTDKVDFLDMWRQAFALWKANHNAGELTRDELESHEQTASDHINYSPLEQELMTIFSPDLKRSELNVLSITDVIKVLQPSLDSIGRGHQTQVGFAIAKVFGDYKYPKCRYRQNKGAFYYLTKK